MIFYLLHYLINFYLKKFLKNHEKFLLFLYVLILKHTDLNLLKILKVYVFISFPWPKTSIARVFYNLLIFSGENYTMMAEVFNVSPVLEPYSWVLCIHSMLQQFEVTLVCYRIKTFVTSPFMIKGSPYKIWL